MCLYLILIWSRKKESNLRLRHLNAYVKLQFKILPNLNYYVVLSITPFLEISSPEVGLEPTTQGLKFQIIKVAVRRFYKLRCLMSLALPTELLWHIELVGFLEALGVEPRSHFFAENVK